MAFALFADIREMSLEQLSAFEKYLSADRLEKVKKYKSEENYRNGICADLLLRSALCKHYGFDNRKLEFSSSPLGKPFLLNNDIQFSLSHSKNLISCIVGGKFSGTDVEFVNRNIDVSRLIRRFHPNEASFILNIKDPNEQKNLFFRLWTLKEAYLKAKGIGIVGGLSSFCVTDFDKYHPIFSDMPNLYTICFEENSYALSFISDEDFITEFVNAHNLLLMAENLNTIN